MKFLRAYWKNAGLLAIGTFFLAILFTVVSKLLMDSLDSLIISFILLSFIILLGIIFDTIGVAAAAASVEAPLHAQAAKKVTGAKQGLIIIRNADKVGSFCNDVVGDICGTLSGAIGISIVLGLAAGQGQIIWTTIMTAAVAAFTVGGKALGKTLAINKATEIVLWSGKFLYWLETSLGIRLLSDTSNKRGK